MSVIGSYFNQPIEGERPASRADFLSADAPMNHARVSRVSKPKEATMPECFRTARIAVFLIAILDLRFPDSWLRLGIRASRTSSSS